MNRGRRYALSVQLLSILATLPSYSATVTFREAELEHIEAGMIGSRVDGLDAGDTVIFIQANGVRTSFHLGPYLGSGEMGDVFRLEGPYAPPRVIKFQKLGGGPRRFMVGEVEAMKRLKVDNLPHSEMHDYHPWLFVTKDFIDGPHLGKVAAGWSRFPAEKRAALLRDLSILFRQISDLPEFYYTDLRVENIRLDEATGRFKVVDPGFVRPGAGGAGQLSRVRKSIGTASYLMNRELTAAACSLPVLTAMLVLLDASPADQGSAVDHFLAMKPTLEDIRRFKGLIRDSEFKSHLVRQLVGRARSASAVLDLLAPEMSEPRESNLEEIAQLARDLELKFRSLHPSSEELQRFRVLADFTRPPSPPLDIPTEQVGCLTRTLRSIFFWR